MVLVKDIWQVTWEGDFFQVVNTVLRGFPHVLLHSCSGQRQNLAALLSVLKVKIK